MRFPATMGTWGPKDQGTRILASENAWGQLNAINRRARAKNRRTMIFAGPSCDVLEDWTGPLFHLRGTAHTLARITHDGKWTEDDLPDSRPLTANDVRGRLWHNIRITPFLAWQVLTKRTAKLDRHLPLDIPRNLWMGVSAENQEWADTRITHLLESRAQRTFLSLEPFIGEADIRRFLDPAPAHRDRALDWVIVGGESGPQSRPTPIEWIQRVVDDCLDAQVPVYVKQLGTNYSRAKDTLKTDYKAENPDLWPESLRVQQFPNFNEGL
jgi:hypothetical protein